MGYIHFACIMFHSLANTNSCGYSRSYQCNLGVDGQISIAIYTKNEQCLEVRCDSTLVSLSIHNDDIFVTCIESKKVKTHIYYNSYWRKSISNSWPQGGDNYLYKFSINFGSDLKCFIITFKENKFFCTHLYNNLFI